MFARPGDGNTVEQFEKIKIKAAENSLGGTLFNRKFRPEVKRSLSTPEYLLNASLASKFLAEVFRISFISQGKLISQVVKTIVDRGGREHQNLCLDPFANNLVHQPLVAGLSLFKNVIIAKIV